MQNSANRFQELIEKREQLLQEHCKDFLWAELCNYPEERFWYCQNIAPLDKQIVDTANSVIVKFSIPSKFAKDIHDVYSNKWLNKLIKPKSGKQESQPEK